MEKFGNQSEIAQTCLVGAKILAAAYGAEQHAASPEDKKRYHLVSGAIRTADAKLRFQPDSPEHFHKEVARQIRAHKPGLRNIMLRQSAKRFYIQAGLQGHNYFEQAVRNITEES
jgi:hypothetical protein